MFRSRASLATLLVATVLTGCSTGTSSRQAAVPSASPNNEGHCDASGAAFAIGRRATPELVEQVRKASGSQNTRLIKPNTPYTTDYREERVNLRVIYWGVVREVYRG
ncbi:I78 family peptidase inhibitor [Pseudomonas sichuanensis]|uniref:I78 family peptidase inhibitor n=1 Tax=Pseudomonas sichuanensis TaxID=2213015 RepID=UPI0024475642|nr:I78 family peptidase inhibitor [Pseudomonas sichuanensis]MDH0733094.1 I78 family peptidase inhibitor [Pseudomonas sichuanensis]MDH1582632.1 I78 family peptidase inhibitor [Pseudomonas sichuanensis]MDH1592545.1 I78 family peptidase inhibitor [Pseudomonas sichuanensis]MDH1597703.1 I78 family peptidase inhibitor [Pseudomonas sichuanensis]